MNRLQSIHEHYIGALLALVREEQSSAICFSYFILGGRQAEQMVLMQVSSLADVAASFGQAYASIVTSMSPAPRCTRRACGGC
jgi:hypothetical protein